MTSRLVWGHSALTLALDTDGPVRLVVNQRSGQPLVEVLVAGEGSSWSGTRGIDTAVGARLRYTGHRELTADGWSVLEVDLADDRLAVTVTFRTREGLPAFQTWTRVRATGTDPVTLHAVSSFAAGGLTGTHVLLAESDWLAENRWQQKELRESRLPDVDLDTHRQPPRGALVVTSHGSWSTGEYLPTGVLHDTATGQALAWQVEHNGAWRWELGERLDGLYVAAFGPTDADHQWQHTLEPGQEFTTVPVGIAFGANGFEDAVAALTRYRRAIRRLDDKKLPVVFNDYMNTISGDPTTEKLLPLIDAAARAGAEYFCVDAGWYDEDGTWWDSVGAWTPSTTRFPNGLNEVIDRITTAGMAPGLWLEPEVVGVRSPLAESLPPDAFFQRNGGIRQLEHGRYHLDLTHPAAVAHLDATVDRLVNDFGIRYFKLDYNINPGPGTTSKVDSAGDGMLAHNRAYLRWLEGVLDRHPGLVLENCASGAMRMDYAILSRLQLQSTSDQQNPLHYPPIAVAAPMAVLPEQSASWAYPQPAMSDEEIAFTLCTGMLGRLYLSGHVDRMSAEQFALVHNAVATHKAIREDLARAVPFWPLGLPTWTAPWLALGLRTEESAYLGVWRRPGATEDVELPITHLRGDEAEVDVLFPTELPHWPHTWHPGTGVLELRGTETPAARILRVKGKTQ